MITVESIEAVDKVRQRITLSSGECFWLYRSDVRELKLKEGDTLTVEEVSDVIMHKVMIYARKKVLELLERMDRTESELRNKLKEKEFSEEAIDDAIEYGKKFHYIDDFRYTVNYIQARCTTKSRKQIQYALGMKGISSDVFQDAFMKVTEQLMSSEGEEAESPEVTAVRKQIQKKTNSYDELSYEEKQKLLASLYRKGFSSFAIRCAIKSMEE